MKYDERTRYEQWKTNYSLFLITIVLMNVSLLLKVSFYLFIGRIPSVLLILLPEALSFVLAVAYLITVLVFHRKYPYIDERLSGILNRLASIFLEIIMGGMITVFIVAFNWWMSGSQILRTAGQLVVTLENLVFFVLGLTRLRITVRRQKEQAEATGVTKTSTAPMALTPDDRLEIARGLRRYQRSLRGTIGFAFGIILAVGAAALVTGGILEEPAIGGIGCILFVPLALLVLVFVVFGKIIGKKNQLIGAMRDARSVLEDHRGIGQSA